MKSRHSTEITLLLMACSWKPSATRNESIVLLLEQYTPDWDRLLTLANYHRLTPFLYHALNEIPSVPDAFRASLRQECLHRTTDNLIKLQEYHRLTALLDKQAIEHIPFKGIYLAEHSYPERGLRPIGDMDILVDKKDVQRVIDILSPDGYRIGDKHKPYLEHPAGVIWDELSEISLFKPYFDTSRFDIDLHWRVNSLLREIGEFEVSDFRSTPDLIIENQVILLVLHHGVNNSWERIGYINDLYFLLHRQDLNWEWLLKTLEQRQLERIFFTGLHWCQTIWEFPVTAEVQQQMDVYNLARLTETREKRWENERPALFRTLLVDFASTKVALIDKLKVYGHYSRNFMFRSTVITINSRPFFIPKRWGFLTAMVRVFLSLVRSR
ncbi:nucleotidyltransferase domain-containing protein [Spirosoma sordidisoli]|uniref:Nucleotidyltransferase family protein n=1 Tax=Spirosoma sordidisoli TaxID=2502893 RepID=A0A4Q2UTP6_9BACT|nr:nucleotidyltransferase family protein [Spirosoma sordidisoli]RYC71321.1 hypothetical protein EQG79_04040 [Spirosoma sordidisoli]